MPTSPPVHQWSHQQAARKQDQKDYNRTKRKNQSFYGSHQWRKVSQWYRKQSPLCEYCKAEGSATIGDVVDHIIEIKDGGDPYSADNLQTLCHRHHNRKTADKREGRVKSLGNA